MPTRTYSASEIRQLVDFMRKGGDLSASEIAGMEKLVDLLKHFENMTDADIATEVERLLRSKQ